MSDDMAQRKSVTLTLRPFQAGDAETIVSWLKDEYALRQWSADRYGRFPITAADMRTYYRTAAQQGGGDFQAMTALGPGGDIVGYFTLRRPGPERDMLRLGFVIVDDRLRGQGYGKAMLALAIRLAFTSASRVTLGVFENNDAAIRCYRACGFREVPVAEPEWYVCMGQVWECVEMELRRPGRAARGGAGERLLEGYR